MLRRAALLGSLFVFLAAAPASALFHLAHISEVMSGGAGDPNLQYVEITAEINSQNLVTHTRLTAFNCDGSLAGVLAVLPTDLPDQLTATRSWIMASPDDATFFGATGIHPDYVFSPGLPSDCGMVCWGAPGVLPPTDPGTWNPALLIEGSPAHKNYVDCLAYGPYTGPLLPGTGTPTGLIAGTGSYSLTRMTNTDDVSVDYTYACPTPKNFAGQSGTLGACEPVPEEPLLGTKIVLKVNGAEPDKTTMTVLSKDPASDLGHGPGSADDPTLNPSAVRVYATGGDQFDITYPLNQSSWHTIGMPGALGYRYVDRALVHGPIKTVLVKPGKVVKVVGKGSLLGHTLATEPTPVRALLMLGDKTYCLQFGGTRTFTPNVSYKAIEAPRPPLAVCLP